MPDDWITNQGRIEAVRWGRAADTQPGLAERGTPCAPRVMGAMNEHPANLALPRARVVEGVLMDASPLHRFSLHRGKGRPPLGQTHPPRCTTAVWPH